MKTEEIRQLFNQFEAAASELEGIECWSARELQKLLGYSKWENFEEVIIKAKEACTNAGEQPKYHFPDVRKVIEADKGAQHEIDEILLTRYACYLIAQNGDSRKAEIAFAQNYFAVQTRRAELVEQRLLEFERVKAREKLINDFVSSLHPFLRQYRISRYAIRRKKYLLCRGLSSAVHRTKSKNHANLLSLLVCKQIIR